MTRVYMGDPGTALDLYTDALRFAPNEPAIYSAIAEAHEALGDYMTAIFFAQQARQFAAGNPHYHRQLAALYVQAGDLHRAVETYEALLARFPEDVDALLALGQLYTTTGRTDDALSTYDRLILLTGDAFELHRQRLQLYRRLGDAAGIEATLQAMQTLSPGDPDVLQMLGEFYVQQGRLDEGIAVFEKIVAADPYQADALLALTDLYRKQGRAQEADALVERSLNDDTAPVPELLTRASALAERATYDPEARAAAVQSLHAVLEKDPGNADALVQLGLLRQEEGAYGEAATLFARALEENPRDPAVWTRAAGALLASGDAAQAISVADEGLLLFPGHVPLLRVLADGYLRERMHDAAVERLEEALVIMEHDPAGVRTQAADLMASLGLAYAYKGLYQTSDSLYARALEADPDNAAALNNYAFGLALRDLQLAKARELAKQAVLLDPANPAYLDTLGWIYLKLERYQEAEAWIQKALDTGRASALTYEHFGDLQARMGNYAEARRAWEQALELSPGNAALQTKLERQQR